MQLIDSKKVFINNKKRNLVYRVRHYEPKEEGRIFLSEKNRRASSKTIEGKTYYLTKIEDVELDERKEKIEKIFQEKLHSGNTLLEEIEFLWETKFCHKNQGDKLEDFCSKVLSALADYYIAGHEGEFILDERLWERIKNYEVANFETDANINTEFTDEEKANKPEINKISKNKRKKRDRKFVGQTKRWKNSTTCRMDKIYSYDNTKPEREFILGKYVDIKPRVAVKYDRKIDKSKPYLSSWETVDTDGFFLFNDKIFIVKDKQYKCNPLADKGFVQDKILCYMQDDKYYFYDMEVKELKEVREITT